MCFLGGKQFDVCCFTTGADDDVDDLFGGSNFLLNELFSRLVIFTSGSSVTWIRCGFSLIHDHKNSFENERSLEDIIDEEHEEDNGDVEQVLLVITVLPVVVLLEAEAEEGDEIVGIGLCRLEKLVVVLMTVRGSGGGVG